ncbi:GntR family transcriptional regulator [Pullulanibacillus camelliae]|uniref:GntR family transcriptional regulator n=1 Tax=Pullulanibacillus camelliae TaxID=1707096 RepID=A0A8J2YJ26_9BACL|nr:GntR family transcriptional regulator [Pullulanibacillus camelliae]GGE45617.1 GntR family transcriptional regulator [Pullulanibacillus camelliae]
MFEIKPIKKVTVTERIMEQIAQLITTGKIKPGDKLPTERDLAEQFGVTRARVREALRALSLIGLITIKAGEGSFVNKKEAIIPSDTITLLFHNEIHNLDEIYAARKLIESEIFIEACKFASDDHLKQLETKLQDIVSADEQTSPETFLHLLEQFDLYAGEICGNQIYYKLMQTIIHLRRESSLKLLHVPGAIEDSIHSRSKMLIALKSRQPDKVKEALDRFFFNSKHFYDNIIDEK